jgi:hypothetical protein
MIDYYLNANAKNVSLQIKDANGNTIRTYSNADTMYKIPDVNIPHYWIRPQQILSAEKGSHRFLWDMRYTSLNIPPSYPISATYQNTAPNETSPFIMPGTYTAMLTADGKTYQQSFTIKMDPRIKTPGGDIQRQHDLSVMVYNDRLQIMNAVKEINDVRRKIKERLPDAKGTAITDLNMCDTLAASFIINQQGSAQQSFGSLNGSLTSVFNVLQESDMPPTSQAIAAANNVDKAFKTLWQRWVEVRNKIKDCLGEK